MARAWTRSESTPRRLALVFLLAACLSAGGCRQALPRQTKAEPAVPPGGLLLRGAGATFPSVLYKSWFADYQKRHPDTVVAYDAAGSGEGVRRFIGAGVPPQEQVDFGASDAAMTDEQLERVPSGALMLPMTAGSVAIAYNLPGFAGDLKLSRAALAGIFSNEIQRWDDPRLTRANPALKLPRQTITLVVRQDSSGTTFAFTKHLDAISPDWRKQYSPATLINWRGNAIRARGNENMAGVIQNAQGSIGYVGYEFARQLGLKMALVENKAGKFVGPSSQSASRALAGIGVPENLRVFVPDPAGDDSYPIVTLTWILLYRGYPDPRKAAALADLFSWCLGEGQQDAPRYGYAPLPADLAARSRAAVERLRPR